MVKEEKTLFFRVFFVVVLILFVNIGMFVVKYGNNGSGFTGFSVKSTVFNTYSEMPFSSKLFLIGQWTLLILLLLFIVFRDNKLKKQSMEVISINVRKKPGANRTDLDTLYEILKQKKKLGISTISKAFNINKEIALEWGKILESGGLAIIDYPGFGEPVIMVVDKMEIKKEEKARNPSLLSEDNKKSKIDETTRKLPAKEPRHIRKAKEKIKKMNEELKKIKARQSRLK